MSDRIEVPFGKGTTPERVREAVERAQESRDRSKGKASTAERERFFAHAAEEVKRAGGRPR